MNEKNIERQINIGIYGFGVVGKAIAQGFNTVSNIRVYDIKEKIDPFKELIDNSEIIFICLPTPMNNDKSGKIDLSIIDKEITKIAKHLHYQSDKVIVIKSTVIPGTTRKYQDLYPKLNFVFNPEFLTEKASRLDFINTSRIILGGKTHVTRTLLASQNYIVPVSCQHQSLKRILRQQSLQNISVITSLLRRSCILPNKGL